MALRRLKTMHLPDWWDNENQGLKDGCEDHFYSCYWYYLCVVYGIICITALVQLIRIHLRLQNYGWTIQKVFHLLNCVICLLRALTFGLHSKFNDMKDAIGSYTVQLFVFDLPSLLFFTTYTLLVLFWAEIYHQVSNNETRNLRLYFRKVNLVVYIVQACLWLMTIPDDTRNMARYLSAGWLTCVFLVVVIGFLIYGSRLFYLLSKFPTDSHGLKRRLHEVGGITVVCSICFVIRAVLMFMYILDKDDFDLDLMENDLLNIIFYVLCEVIPTAVVLLILRQLPPKPVTTSLDYRAPLRPQDQEN